MCCCCSPWAMRYWMWGACRLHCTSGARVAAALFLVARASNSAAHQHYAPPPTRHHMQGGGSVVIFCATQAACVDTARHVAAKLAIPARTSPAAAAVTAGSAAAGIATASSVGGGPPLPPIPRDQLPAALAHRVLKPTPGLAEVRRRPAACMARLACAPACPACMLLNDAAPAPQQCAHASDATTPQLLSAGVAFHHAGLDREERLLVEEAFRSGARAVRVVLACACVCVCACPLVLVHAGSARAYWLHKAACWPRL